MRTGDRIERIFRDSLSIDVPSPTTDIIENGLLDSLAFVMLLYEIEQEFEITIPPEELDIDELRTVQRISALVDGLAAAP